MSLRCYIPRDTTARALGAEQLAQALQEQVQRRGLDCELVRNGSRGAFWLEPLLEVERDGETVGSEAICHNKVIEELAMPGDVVLGMSVDDTGGTDADGVMLFSGAGL